ncbi:MAG TPA: pitrilysin family protein [Candidatus Paceibacterota bacterium]
MQEGYKHFFHKFDSGLRLISVPMEGTKTVTVLVLVGTGSKYEIKEINGISHFLEHMMFKGTVKRPGKMDIARELDAIGAEYNAFTGKEYTGYYAKASMDKIDTIMDVVFDIFLNSKLAQEDIDTERGVIVEELNMYRDMPQRYVSDLFEKLLYGDQPAGWDIGGEKETVMSLKREQFVNYFNSHYVAKNTIISVAGNVDPEVVKNKTAEYFADIRKNDSVTKLPVVEEQFEPALLLHFKETDQTHFYLGFRSCNMYDDRKYALGILGTVLGGGMSSRLFEEVRDKRGLAYYVGADNDTSTDTGYFKVKAGVNNEKIYEAIKVIVDELRKIKDNGITEEELQRAKDNISGSMALGLEHSDAVANAYAGPILFEDKVLTPEEELVKIKKVTLEEVHQVAKDIFDNKKLNLAVIGPFKDEESFKKILSI